MAALSGCGAPKLSKLATDVLIRYRDCITDIGWVTVEQLRSILSHCSEEDLRRIEDGTLAGSGRDISWYTWDFWARIYERKLGGLRASTTQHKPLPTKAPEDYEAPYQGTGPAVADWRSMMDRDIAADHAKAESTSQRLRDLYDAANRDKANRGVEVCDIKPGQKRRRLTTGSASSGSGAPMDKAKAKMLRDLGLIKPIAPGTKTYTSGPTKTVMKVTKTVTIHRASQGAAAAAPLAARPGPVQPPSRHSNGHGNGSYSQPAGAQNRLGAGSPAARSNGSADTSRQGLAARGSGPASQGQGARNDASGRGTGGTAPREGASGRPGLVGSVRAIAPQPGADRPNGSSSRGLGGSGSGAGGSMGQQSGSGSHRHTQAPMSTGSIPSRASTPPVQGTRSITPPPFHDGRSPAPAGAAHDARGVKRPASPLPATADARGGKRPASPLPPAIAAGLGFGGGARCTSPALAAAAASRPASISAGGAARSGPMSASAQASQSRSSAGASGSHSRLQR